LIEQIKPLITNRCIELATEYLHSEGWIVEYKKTREFESKIEDFLGVQHCILTTSGTTALALACMAMFSRRDYRSEILVPNFTMIGTAHAITLASSLSKNSSCFIRLVDVGTDLCLDIDSLFTINNVKGVIYVSINGRASSLHRVRDLCKVNRWFLIEDACQAFGSKFDGRYLGTFGDVGCFSLSPQKIISTGQGGIVVTNDTFTATKIRKLKDQGRIKPGVDKFDSMGFNFKYTDLQAVLGLEQLRMIDWRIERKKHIYAKYLELLGNVPGVRMIRSSPGFVPWYVDIFSKDRDSIVKALEDNYIGCKEVYPPLHRQYPFCEGFEGYTDRKFPVTVTISKEGLWLPSHLELEDSEIEFICSIVMEAAETAC